jgi:hypothetical protein
MKKRYSLLIIALIFSFSFSLLNIQTVEAQAGVVNTGNNTVNKPTNNEPQTFATLQNPLKAKSVTDLLYSIVDLVIVIGLIFAVLMFIFIGFKFVLARGDSGALKEARQWFLWAVVGTAVLISSKVIVEVVKKTFISAGVVNEDLFNKKF